MFKHCLSNEQLNKKGIYIITNLVNGKYYIGRTNKTFKGRVGDHFNHLTNNNHGNIHLQNAWNLYGKDSFVMDVLEFTKELDNINEIEGFYIEKYNAVQDGYNRIDSRDGVAIYTEEMRNKISNARKIHVNKMKELYGTGVSPESIEKNRQKKLGKVMPKGTGEKISKALKGKKGKPCSEETKRKLSKINKGENNPNFGKNLKEETKRKIKEANIATWNTVEKKLEHSQLNGINLTIDDYLKIKNILLDKVGKQSLESIFVEVCQEFNIKRQVVKAIRYGKHWSNELLLNGKYEDWIKDVK